MKVYNRKKLIIVFLILVIILTSCCAYYIYWGRFKKTTFLKLSSPHHLNKVELIQIGNALIASPDKIEIYFKNKYDETARIETAYIANKWASNGKELYNITWKNDNHIQIKGKEKAQTC